MTFTFDLFSLIFYIIIGFFGPGSEVNRDGSLLVGQYKAYVHVSYCHASFLITHEIDVMDLGLRLIELAVGVALRAVFLDVGNANGMIPDGSRTCLSLRISTAHSLRASLLTLKLKSANGPLVAQNWRCPAAELRFGSTHMFLFAEELFSCLL